MVGECEADQDRECTGVGVSPGAMRGSQFGCGQRAGRGCRGLARPDGPAGVGAPW